jgi:CheY-like chemotaxis protein
MAVSFKDFSGTAKDLARNPLGIVALFIVLVYGFAALVTAFASSLTFAERLPLIYFLVIFPVLVLGVFAWLVSRHSGKLFAPSDFKNEDNYVKMQFSAVASLAAATVKSGSLASESELQRVVDVVRDLVPRKAGSSDGWHNHLLWVDDRPENNANERRAFEAIGLRFTLALSTDDALKYLGSTRFAAVLSDMGRREGPREGYSLLDALRKGDAMTPFFIYAGSNAPEHKRETRRARGPGMHQ